MAEAILGKIGEVILGKVGDNLVAPIQHMCYFKSNITELETQLKGLKRTREDVRMGADENRRKVRVVGRTVEAWLTIAGEVTTEAEGIIQDKAKVMEGCLNGWCPNLKLRYSLSRKAVKKTKEVVDLKVDGVWYTQSSYSPPLPCLETITNRDFMGFESRRLIMEEIIKALKHDEINLFGVCGMGGVGKTTMVNEVAKRAKEHNYVDEVAIAVVGQKPILTDVQACIADTLGLENLRDLESPIARAELLRRRLLQDNKKVLVILDDIWVEFDLQAMGIPLEGADKNFKVLYTSRTRDLWHDLRTKKEIPLEVLSKDEAWQLFREKAGDSADAPDLQPIAKQIVDECGCLPLALVLIGRALSKKSGRNYNKEEEIWKGTLDRLTCTGSTPADKDLSSRLALSYESLEDEQTKHLFLLCCLFSEDEDIRIEDLARYGLGLSLFDGIPEMEKVRPQVFLIVDDLKSRCLLLDGYYGLPKRIPPNVISRLVNLEELYVGGVVDLRKGRRVDFKKLYGRGKFKDWEGEGKEEGRNANLRCLPQLKRLIIISCDMMEEVFWKDQQEDVHAATNRIEFPKWEVLKLVKLPSLVGFCRGIDQIDFPQLKELCLEDIPQVNLLFHNSCNLSSNSKRNDNFGFLSLFPEKRDMRRPSPLSERYAANLREICGGPVPAHSFGELTFIQVQNCGRFRNLFQLPIVGCLPQLKSLIIISCGMMEEVFWKDQQEDVHAAANRIEFPKLEVLKLEKLPSLMCFCRGIDHIDFPQLKELRLKDIPRVNLLFHNSCNLSFNSKRNDNSGFLSLFPEKVSLPNLEVLDIDELENLERLGRGPVLPVGSFSKLNKIFLRDCGKLLCVIPSRFLPMLRELQELTVESCNSLEVVFELEGLESNEPNLEILSPLKFVKLRELPKLNCISKRDPVCFKYIQTLEIHNCNSLRYVFAPTKTKSIPQLRELKVSSCEMLSRIVAKENGLGESSVDEVEFPQLKCLELLDLPKLLSFFPNVNTTTLAQSTDQYHNPLQPQPLFNEKVAIPSLEYIELSGLQNVSDLWGSELPTNSFSKLKNLQVTDCTSLRNIPCISWFGDLNNTTQGLQEVARLLYTNYGVGVLALGSNGTMTMWKWEYDSEHNPSGKVTTKVLPSGSHLAMTNDVTDVNLEEVVPCMALSKNYSENIISACGGAISLFYIWGLDIETFKVERTFMPPPPASTFLAFHPQDNEIIAIGMEDSTIRIYNHREDEWVPQDVLPAPISFVAYSCDSQLVYTSFCDGNIGVFDANSLTLVCRIVPSIYLYPTMLSG
ncbi:hypothetical protein RHGRI_006516 [Rhododendron griersonianum]|nr:hypothetical protein RHGRI_006516 [Rhododendron griersonianum]